MNITTNYCSPTFGKLKVNTSQMTPKQQDNSDKLDKSLHYSDGYQKFDDYPVDVFILPKKGSKSAIEVRFADPHTGLFYRKDNKIIRYTYNQLSGNNANDRDFHETKTKGTDTKKETKKYAWEDAVNEINNTLEEIYSEKIEKPEGDPKKMFAEDTEVCRYKQDYLKDLITLKEDFMEENLSKEAAESSALGYYQSSDMMGNKDENF